MMTLISFTAWAGSVSTSLIVRTFFFKKSLPEDMLINFRERRRERETTHTHRGASCTCPHRGWSHNLGYVPWMEIEPTTFWCMGRYSNQFSHLTRACMGFFIVYSFAIFSFVLKCLYLLFREKSSSLPNMWPFGFRDMLREFWDQLPPLRHTNIRLSYICWVTLWAFVCNTYTTESAKEWEAYTFQNRIHHLISLPHCLKL